jgi:hypothetical protein
VSGERSRDGFPASDEFEGSGHSAEDKLERENPDVNRSNALSSAMSLPIVKLRLPLAKPSMPSATTKRSKTEGAWQLAGSLKMPGNSNSP